MEKIMKQTILIDLDGVLNEYKGNFNKDFITDMKVGADEFLEKLSQKFEIKIFTKRNKLLTAKWLIKNNLDKFVEDITNVKDVARLYVDDRTVCFEGNYLKTFENIKNFKPYWK